MVNCGLVTTTVTDASRTESNYCIVNPSSHTISPITHKTTEGERQRLYDLYRLIEVRSMPELGGPVTGPLYTLKKPQWAVSMKLRHGASCILDILATGKAIFIQRKTDELTDIKGYQRRRCRSCVHAVGAEFGPIKDHKKPCSRRSCAETGKALC
jgi:hypothetical protein